MKPVSLQVAIPERGFRWVRLDGKGNWVLADPPANWSEEDHVAAESDEASRWGEAQNYYLAAASNECTTGTVALLNQPDIYLFFTVARPGPGTILRYANLFGLLGSWDSTGQSVSVRRAKKIFSQFDWGAPEHPRYLQIQLESASTWLLAFAQTRTLVSDWSRLSERGEIRRAFNRYKAGENDEVLELLNKTYPLGAGNLTFSLGFDSQGEIAAQVHSSSLRDLLRVQFGLAVAAGTSHRQCQECGHWFAVRPGLGRPDKKFCSNACRMRAMRKRKRSG